MSRQVTPHERMLFDVIRESGGSFYYTDVIKMIDREQFKIRVEKMKEEMVGHAFVTLHGGERIDYEIRYNRIVNLSEGYTMLVSGGQAS